MYKKITVVFFFIALLYPLLAFSQGGEVKQLSPFTSIDISHKGKVILTQDTSHTLRIEPADKRDDVKTTVSDKTLSIDAPSDVTLYISMKEIEELSISGYGSVASESPIKSNELRLTIGGSGRIEIKDADVKKLTTDISGVGKVIVSGKAETSDINISGSGRVDASGLKTSTSSVNISGLGKSTVDATDNLN